jgi:hypothetical protein
VFNGKVHGTPPYGYTKDKDKNLVVVKQTLSNTEQVNTEQMVGDNVLEEVMSYSTPGFLKKEISSIDFLSILLEKSLIVYQLKRYFFFLIL